jgi:hypothetical protein
MIWWLFYQKWRDSQFLKHLSQGLKVHKLKKYNTKNVV